MLALLQATLPADLALTGIALLRGRVTGPPPRATPERPRTILLSGGKMTKALQLARSFHAAGHRVVLCESARYRFTGHRFSRAVDRFHVVPAPGAPRYAEALLEIVRAEGVDVYVPVCSPAASYHDAAAKPLLEQHCEVLHGDLDVIRLLDDKFTFARAAADAGLPVPDTHRVTSAAEVTGFDFAVGTPPYVLKSLRYDPVHRLDLTRLPRPTPAETAAFARSKPISAADPWILQSFVDGREFCTHGTARDGRLQVYCCCPSSAFQVNYESVDRPAIEEWVTELVAALKLTGQFSFDFIEAGDGRVYAIECNPRTHSAITLFDGHPGLAAAYLETGAPPIRPLPGGRPTYWVYHELWRLLTGQGRVRDRLRILLRGRDAVFSWDDPLPFLLLHHLHVPWLLAGNLLRGKDWIRVDLNIGKLVEPAGD